MPDDAGHPSARPRRTAGRDERFVGRIAGFGTASGTRIVLGMWDESPFGRFADAMIERADGHRILLAPTAETARYIASTYTFDEVRVVPVSRRMLVGAISVTAGPLVVHLAVGGLSPLGRLLRLVPRRIATRPAWLRLVDPFARVIVRGARTAGTAGGGRREYYGVTLARRIRSATASWDGVDLGEAGRLSPPVRFGFGSAPPEPHVVDVVTTIRG